MDHLVTDGPTTPHCDGCEKPINGEAHSHGTTVLCTPCEQQFEQDMDIQLRMDTDPQPVDEDAISAISEAIAVFGGFTASLIF